METPSSPRLDRTMSTKSAAAVTTVQELNARFGSLQDRLRQAAEAVASDGATLPELFAAKQELAQIVGQIEKFQFDEVDAVATHHLTSGKDEVRQQRKSLTRAVTALGEEAASKHEIVAARIKSMAAKLSENGGES
eukprot:jgi/Undpi1/6205/HiC_scaffold_20.g08689.m1